MKNDILTLGLILVGVLLFLFVYQNFTAQQPAYPNQGEMTVYPEMEMELPQKIIEEDAEGAIDYDSDDEDVRPAQAQSSMTASSTDQDPRDSNGLLKAGDGTVYGGNQAYTDQRVYGCFPREKLTSKDLLPQDDSSTWAQVNPTGQGTLKNLNFLQAGHHVGINTVGQTLRNANLQLRSEPPNPQVTVSPWIQTTISPDLNRRSFEVGGCV